MSTEQCVYCLEDVDGGGCKSMIQAQSCIAEAFATIEREHMTPTTQPEPTRLTDDEIAELQAGVLDQANLDRLSDRGWQLKIFVATITELQRELAEAEKSKLIIVRHWVIDIGLRKKADARALAAESELTAQKAAGRGMTEDDCMVFATVLGHLQRNPVWRGEYEYMNALYDRLAPDAGKGGEG